MRLDNDDLDTPLLVALGAVILLAVGTVAGVIFLGRWFLQAVL